MRLAKGRACALHLYIIKAQLTYKAAGSVHPQSIFSVTGGRVTDGTQYFLLQILPAAVIIVHLTESIQSHGIDGKISPRQIRLQVVTIPDLLRFMGIHTVGFATKGGNFYCMSVLIHNNDTEVLPQFANNSKPGRFQNADNRLGTGRCCNVKIAGRLSQQQISYGTAYDIGGKALLCKRVNILLRNGQAIKIACFQQS